MKSRILLFSGALCALSQADIVVKQSLDSPSMKGEMVISVKGQQMRTDIGKDTSAIMDGATGNMLTLMHAQKMVMKVDGATTKAQIEAMKKAAPAADPAAVVAAPKATGKKEKVGEYECEIYEMTANGSTVRMWVAKDFPNYEAINKEMASATASMAAAASGATPPVLPGMTMKTEMNVGGQMITTLLLSAESKAVDAAIFTAPADYKDPAAAVGK
jgi:Domain of unknown function (DUF4412)